jgi:murein DD-endopeptidase MepM/ murein hydrolase activator NlpD
MAERGDRQVLRRWGMRVTFIPGHAGRTVNVILPGWVFNLVIGTVVAAVVMLVGGVLISARMGLELRGLREMRYENEVLRRENQKVRQLEAELSQLEVLRQRVLALANEESGASQNRGRPGGVPPRTAAATSDPRLDRVPNRLSGRGVESGPDRLPGRPPSTSGKGPASAAKAGADAPFAGPYRATEDGATTATSGSSSASTTGWRWPVSGVISKAFSRSSVPGREHHGLDIAAAHGTPVHAARSGQVVFAGKDSVFGQMVLLDHGGNLQSLYGHNSTLRVGAGDRVVAGQEIARVGSTGESSAPHLHFEIRSGGQPIDPRRHLP